MIAMYGRKCQIHTKKERNEKNCLTALARIPKLLKPQEMFIYQQWSYCHVELKQHYWILMIYLAQILVRTSVLE